MGHGLAKALSQTTSIRLEWDGWKAKVIKPRSMLLLPRMDKVEFWKISSQKHT